MNLYEDQLFNLFVENRELAESTKKRYHSQMKLYCEFLKKTPKQLIDDAVVQSDDNIRKWKLNIFLILVLQSVQTSARILPNMSTWGSMVGSQCL